MMEKILQDSAGVVSVSCQDVSDIAVDLGTKEKLLACLLSLEQKVCHTSNAAGVPLQNSAA